MGEIAQEEFLEFMSALNSQKVDYVIVGGYAVIYHGYPGTTGDLNIWVNKAKSNYDRLVKAFIEFQMPIFDMTKDNFLNNPKMDVLPSGALPFLLKS